MMAGTVVGEVCVLRQIVLVASQLEAISRSRIVSPRIDCCMDQSSRFQSSRIYIPEMTIPETTSATLRPQQSTRQTSSFAGDILKLVSGTAFAQILGILAMPFLTRLYEPEAFGTLAIFTSITGILGVIVCMRYELAIMLPESDEEAANLLAVSLLFAVLMALLIIPLVWLGGTTLLDWLNTPQLGTYLWLVPPMVLLSGIFLTLNYWNTRTKHFGRLSIVRVNQSLAVTATKLGLGFAGLASGGAMIGATIGGQALATTVLGGQIWRDDRKIFWRSMRWHEMIMEMKRYRKFPLYDTWSALLNTASWQLPTLMLASLFSSTVVGYYALGFRMLQLPMSFIGSSISQVFFQRASEAYLQGRLSTVVERTFRYLVIIGLFPMLMLAFIGRDVFVVIFGISWAEAGVYTQILSIWAFVWFISSPLSTVLSVLEQQDLLLKWNVVNFTTRLVSLSAGGMLQNPRIAILLFASSGVIVYGYITIIIITRSGVSMFTIFNIIGKYLLIFFPAAIVMIYLLISEINIEIRSLIAGTITACYLITVGLIQIRSRRVSSI